VNKLIGNPGAVEGPGIHAAEHPICSRYRQGCHKGQFWRKITVRTSARVRVYPADAVLSADGFLPSADAVKTASTRTRKKNKKILFLFFIFNYFLFLIIFYFLVVAAGLERENFFQFSIFNPQNPQDPQTPRAPRASRAKPQEEEGFFGLVPLVTHPSSISLLGGLTPKFLSLSLHSL
jgi:hypothetical protein